MTLSLLTILIAASPNVEAAAPSRFGPEHAERFASLALSCVHREYPNKIAHVLQGDRDARPPRHLTPVFYGCFDWHSAVHGHWLLARLARKFPDAPFASKARKALDRSLVPGNVAAEVRYLAGRNRESFERPYGLAWLLQLAAELHEWDDPQAKKWARTIEPLERAVAARIESWLPKLSHPMRTGEHSQTAFALGLTLDWARSRGERRMEQLIVDRARHYFERDVRCPLAFEPGGEDFLSPCLAEADLMRRVLPAEAYAEWLRRFLESPTGADVIAQLKPAEVTDPTDGKLAHLDGLNLSRAWMLEGIAQALPVSDPMRARLASAARAHADAGIAAVTGEHYEGGHWLGSFAAYLTTR